MTRYRSRLSERRGLEFGNYEELGQRWVDNLEDSWSSIVEFLDVRFSSRGDVVLGDRSMAGAQWFRDSTISYAEHVFRGKSNDAVAIRQIRGPSRAARS